MKINSRGWGGVVSGLFFFAAVAVTSQAARALPLDDAFGAPAAEAFDSVPADAAVDFTSIVALNNCSGALVRLENSLPDDRALVMTNGHCKGGADFMAPGTAMHDVPVSRTMNLLSSNGNSVLGKLTADRIFYGTMTRTDMLLYRLTQTYAEIENRYGVRGLTLSSRHPEAQRSITIVSGYWRRIYQCNIERFVLELREDAYTWNDSLRYSKPGCDTIHGTSGSPIIDTATGEIVGINNTGNDDNERCTMNNPCEVDAEGNITYEKDTSYGQQTYWLYSCLNAQNQLDLNKAGCLLPR